MNEFTGRQVERGIQTEDNENTYESKSSTLGLLLTTKLEARRIINTKILTSDIEGKYTHCLQRFKESCILYLHTVHSNLSTTFLVVFACYD